MFKYHNVLLMGLSRHHSPLLSELQPVELKQRDVLYDMGSPIEYMYFPDSAVGSVVNIMKDGASIEIGMVGYEGVVGVSALLGETNSQNHVVIQLPGKGHRIRTSVVVDEFQKNLEFRTHVLGFVHTFMDLCGQSAACNRLHQVEQRCARWLLMSSDRTRSSVLPLTQEYLSVMVGVRRSSISEAAMELQRAGYISYKKGQVTITDRKGLEQAACECYVLDHERFHRIIK